MHSSASFHGIVGPLKGSMDFTQHAIWTCRLFNCSKNSLTLPQYSCCCLPVSSYSSVLCIPSLLSPRLYSPLRPSFLWSVLQTFGFGPWSSLLSVIFSLSFHSLQGSYDKAYKNLSQTHCIHISCSSPSASPLPGVGIAQQG